MQIFDMIGYSKKSRPNMVEFVEVLHIKFAKYLSNLGKKRHITGWNVIKSGHWEAWASKYSNI